MLSTKVTPAGRAEVEKVGVLPSASVAAMLKLRLTPSVTDLAPMAARTGAWLPTSLTVIETISESMATPSEALKVTVKVPLWVKSGVQLNEPLPLPLSTKVAPEGKAEVKRAGVVPSGSMAETLKLKFISSVVLCGPIAASCGIWLPVSETETVTTSLSASKPSEAMKVIL